MQKTRTTVRSDRLKIRTLIAALYPSRSLRCPKRPGTTGHEAWGRTAKICFLVGSDCIRDDTAKQGQQMTQHGTHIRRGALPLTKAGDGVLLPPLLFSQLHHESFENLVHNLVPLALQQCIFQYPRATPSNVRPNTSVSIPINESFQFPESARTQRQKQAQRPAHLLPATSTPR